MVRAQETFNLLVMWVISPSSSLPGSYSAEKAVLLLLTSVSDCQRACCSTTPCGYKVSRIFPTTHCACRKRRLSCPGQPPQGERFQICVWYRGCRNSPPPTSWWGAQGYQRFPAPYKPVVDPNIALHAVPAYRASTYLVSAFPALSTSFL